jgi:hypothetical protein
MKITDKQARIANQLLNDVENSNGLISILFGDDYNGRSPREMEADGVKKASINRHGYQIIITLLDPENEAGLDDWADVVIRAEEMMDEVTAEMSHAEAHPNFYKAFKATYNNKYKNN